MSNSIIAANVATTTTAPRPDIFGTILSRGHNLIGVQSAGFTPTSGDLWGTLASPLDPLLAPLGNYGGPTPTRPPLPGSLAIDAGNNALALDGLGNLLTADQRGLARAVSGAVDIGAVENQTPLPGGEDNDGVSYAVEAAAPNNGDGNSDGVPDSEQVNVTSLPNSVNSNYITLQSPTGTSLNAVTPIAPPPANQRAGTGLPQNAVWPVGAIDFSVAVNSGAAVEVVLYMPTGMTINTYYKHNVTTNRWSKFNSAQFVDRNSDGTPDVVLNLTDGGTGDQDGLVNGVIVDPGAPAFVAAIQVQIDVRSVVNLAGQGVIAVALFSSADFDARTVDFASVVFAGASAVSSALQDVNGDGLLDLVLNFRTQDTNLRALYEQLLADDINGDGVLDSTHQEATVALTGNTTDDELFEGSDTLDLFLSGRALRDLLAELAAEGLI